MPTFDFISDTILKFMLERDYRELEICLANEANKSVLILSGSIIETILVDYFLCNLPEGINKEQILRMELKQLVDMALTVKLIDEKTQALSSVIRNYRNLIHPGKELREKEKVTHETANIAKSLVHMISDEIRENFIKNRGYTADEIINKLVTDEHSDVIINNLLKKVSAYEKIKLLNILVDYEPDRIFQDNINQKKFIDILKPLIPKSAITEQLLKLKRNIEMGSSVNVLKNYNFFREDLLLLDTEDIEIILLYVMNLVQKSVSDRDGKFIQKITEEKTFSNLGYYIITDNLISGLENLMGEIILDYDEFQHYIIFSFYELIINSLPAGIRAKIEFYISDIEYSQAFFGDYANGNYLPF